MEIKFEILEGKRVKKTVNETDLRYNHFFGNFIFKKGHLCITTDRVDIPLLDFGVTLIDLTASMVLEKEVERRLNFTHNNSQIYFKKKDEKLIITSSFSQETIKEDFDK